MKFYLTEFVLFKSILQKKLISTFTILLTLSTTFIFMTQADAATVTATGTNSILCDQTVTDATSVTVTRLAGGDCVIEFKKTGSTVWTAPAMSGNARVLVLGGGGGGGAHVGGGGGAGGLIESSTATFTTSAAVTITVGGGGAGASLTGTGCSNPSTGITGNVVAGSGYCNDSSDATRSADGSPSSISGGGTSITALGGGGGASWNYFYAHSGGSGGGNGNGSTSIGLGTSGQGNNGGGYVNTYGTGGGGGAGGVGGTGSNNQGGTGGVGLTITTFGSSRDLAGGGGGGTHDSTTGGGTASFGGGAGIGASSTKATNGTANTGGGGGGAGRSNAYTSYGGNGGSGLVLIRFTPYIATTISAPVVSGNVYKGISTNISVTTNGPGIIRFFQDGIKIANCLNVATTGNYPSYSATCSWKATVMSKHFITARFTSTDSAFSSTTSAPTSVLVLRRSTIR